MSTAQDGSRDRVLLAKNIALVGFMTAGKTQVGERLSFRTGLPFRDVDRLVEEVAKAPVQRIFETLGEPWFRQIESRILTELCAGSGQIIGCGGGTVLRPENRQVLRDRCVTFWLRVSVAYVRTRLEEPGTPQRPLLAGRDLDLLIPELLRQREPLYAEADEVIETDGRTVDDVAEEIVARLGFAT